MLDFAQAERIIKRYVCAACYGHLTLFADRETYDIKCAAGHETGFVTKHWAERRKNESQGEIVEVNQLLRELGIIPPAPKKSAAQTLQELGF